MITITQIFILVVGAVFGIGFIILGIIMIREKHPRNKIPKPPSWLDNRYRNGDEPKPPKKQTK